MFQRLALWIKWHRRAGLLVAPVLVMVAVTGILINHSQGFGWPAEPVYSPLLGWLYGIPAQNVEQGFHTTDDQWLTQAGTSVYLQAQPFTDCEQTLSGAVHWPMGYALLCGQTLIMMTADGQLIEHLNGLPALVSSLGLTADGELALRSAQQAFRLDEQAWAWQPAATEIRWSQHQPLPAELHDALNAQLPLPGLTLERVLLDLHSGRLFGHWGVWLVDASAVLMLFLALSGSLTWGIRQWRKRQRS